LFAWITFSQPLFAQEHCGTMGLNPPNAPDWARYDANRRNAYQAAMSNGHGKVAGNERVIPVVVHLIQETPVQEISDARVQSQIDVLNADFRRLNADTALIPLEFQGIAANTEIRFCLAHIDPNGCPTTGINRVVAPALATHGIADEQALKSFVQWDPHKYLNMWVPVNLKDNLLGYATFPTWLPWAPQNDGVVVNGNNFGVGFGTPASSYNLGRTATHEVGHWFGLYHTFEGGCAGLNPQSCLNSGDEVCDTPPTGGPVFGCPLYPRNTCTETPADHNDQTMNYMDYTDDRCMYMFSAGQKDRMLFFLDNERSQIWSAANLTATGCDGTVSPGCLPIAAFTASTPNVCVGATIQFQDNSFGPATAWEWTFQAGNPATSTLPNPAVTWTQPGTYAVTLRVSNVIGADTLVQNAFVTIAAANPSPLMEGFEGGSTLPVAWYATDADQQGTWTISAAAGSQSQQSVVADNFDFSADGTQDDLVSHVIDLNSIAIPLLSFEHAYKRRGSFIIDSLQVLVSTDCGDTWLKVWEKWGAGLMTVGGYATTGTFIPTAGQWRSDTVDLQAFASASQMRIMFRSIGGNSQAIYLDNINISGLVGAIKPEFATLKVQVYPNPSLAAPSIVVQMENAGWLEARLCDLQGRSIHNWAQHRVPSGVNTIFIPSDIWGNMAAGLYMLNVVGASGNADVKLIKISDH
jgi:hypothetical protein